MIETKKIELKKPFLLYDPVFKSIFTGNENIIGKMISDITGFNYLFLENNIYLDTNELSIDRFNEKFKRCDFIVRVDDDNIINLEINNIFYLVYILVQQVFLMLHFLFFLALLTGSGVRNFFHCDPCEIEPFFVGCPQDSFQFASVAKQHFHFFAFEFLILTKHFQGGRQTGTAYFQFEIFHIAIQMLVNVVGKKGTLVNINGFIVVNFDDNPVITTDGYIHQIAFALTFQKILFYQINYFLFLYHLDSYIKTRRETLHFASLFISFPLQIYRLYLNCATRKDDADLLYIYEEKDENIIKSNFYFQRSYYIVDSLSEKKIVAKKRQLDIDIKNNEKLLFKLLIKESEHPYDFSAKIKLNYFYRLININKNNLLPWNSFLWYVVNSDDIKLQYIQNDDYYLEENDILKIGSAKYIISKLHMKNMKDNNDENKKRKLIDTEPSCIDVSKCEHCGDLLIKLCDCEDFYHFKELKNYVKGRNIQINNSKNTVKNYFF
mgnify:CR=1 FL=1